MNKNFIILNFNKVDNEYVLSIEGVLPKEAMMEIFEELKKNSEHFEVIKCR